MNKDDLEFFKQKTDEIKNMFTDSEFDDSDIDYDAIMGDLGVDIKELEKEFTDYTHQL